MRGEAGPGIPCVRSLQLALHIALHVEPKGWPAAIEAIPDPDERKWADHWLRQQAQIMRDRRAIERSSTTHDMAPHAQRRR